MTKRRSLFGLFAVAVSVAGTLHAAEAPNIMIFLVDDMGEMDTSVPFLTDADGKPKRYPLNNYYRTPSMERLANQGIRFSQFYAMSVCSPSRVSLMTGQNAARHRTTNWINPDQNNAGPNGAPHWNWEGLKKSDVTLPGILREQGYRTIHVGKGHFGPRSSEGADPMNLGFEVNVAGSAIGAPASYFGMQNFDRMKKGKAIPGRGSMAVLGLEKYHGQDIFLSEALTLEAKDRVAQSIKEEKPFYLYFAHYAVHAPFDSDPRFADHYKNSGKPAAAQAFATLIEGMDKSLGDMLDYFGEAGVAENTLVFFLGDNGSDAPLGDQHGVACAEPLRGKKGSHYEGGMRVPFIAAWAKPNPENTLQKRLPIPTGAIQGQVGNITDLYPTLLELVGGAESLNPEGHVVDGRSLKTLLSGSTDPSRPEQFLMHYPHGPHRSNYFTTWRDGEWKVIYHTLPEIPTHGGGLQFEGGHYQLFNLKNDPFEQTNLADSEKETLHRMMGELVAQLKDKKAVYPVSDSGAELIPVIP